MVTPGYFHMMGMRSVDGDGFVPLGDSLDARRRSWSTRPSSTATCPTARHRPSARPGRPPLHDQPAWSRPRCPTPSANRRRRPSTSPIATARPHRRAARAHPAGRRVDRSAARSGQPSRPRSSVAALQRAHARRARREQPAVQAHPRPALPRARPAAAGPGRRRHPCGGGLRRVGAADRDRRAAGARRDRPARRRELVADEHRQWWRWARPPGGCWSGLSPPGSSGSPPTSGRSSWFRRSCSPSRRCPASLPARRAAAIDPIERAAARVERPAAARL